MLCNFRVLVLVKDVDHFFAFFANTKDVSQ
jgi:hypothetical protein